MHSLTRVAELVFHDVLVFLAFLVDNIFVEVRPVDGVRYRLRLAAEALAKPARSSSIDDGAVHEVPRVQVHCRLVGADRQLNVSLRDDRVGVQVRPRRQYLVEYEAVVYSVSIFDLLVGFVYISKQKSGLSEVEAFVLLNASDTCAYLLVIQLDELRAEYLHARLAHWGAPREVEERVRCHRDGHGL